MKKIRMDYIKIMRDLREDNDMTQEQVAKMLGTSQTMYARYERGANELPIRHLIRLCEIYGVSADYFLGLKENDDCAEVLLEGCVTRMVPDKMHKDKKIAKKELTK